MREYLDLLGHHERRQQPDPELPEELRPREPDLVPLRAPPDGGEQLPHLIRPQPDPAVGDAQPFVVDLDVDPRGCVRLVRLACGDRIHRVLQQFPQIDPRTAVQVIAQQIDDPVQINLKILATHPSPLSTPPGALAHGTSTPVRTPLHAR